MQTINNSCHTCASSPNDEAQGKAQDNQDSLAQLDINQLDKIETYEMIKAVKATVTAFAKRTENQAEVVRVLNEPDEAGVSLIHYLTALDYPELIKFVHSYGADINLKARDSNFSPLVIAAAKGQDNLVRTLMSLGAKILNRSRTPELDAKRKTAKRKADSELPFTLLTNASIIKKSEGNSRLFQSHNYLRHPSNLNDNRSEEYDEEDDLRSQDSSVVDFAIQNDHVDILEILVRELSLQDAVKG